MIRQCRLAEIEQIYTIINEAARAYDGKIPPDCYHQPYMPRPELEREMQRLTFYGWYENGVPVGVMGIEESKEVTLIRHAYVLPQWQNKGIGSGLLKHLMLCAGRSACWWGPGRLIQMPSVFMQGTDSACSRIKISY
jgi:GNAT superfamily N-acetyltransferase